jgi:hypothetical protein
LDLLGMPGAGGSPFPVCPSCLPRVSFWLLNEGSSLS